MRIKADTTIHPAGTITYEDEAVRTVALGEVRISERSAAYQVQEMTFKETGRTETSLIGPRGSIYTLHPYGKTGAHQAISFNTGAPLTRHGNEVLFLRLGDIIEATSRAALQASARKANKN